MNACADARYIRKITQADSSDGCGYFGRSLGVQSVEPFGERAASRWVEVFSDSDHSSNGIMCVTNIKVSGTLKPSNGL